MTRSVRAVSTRPIPGEELAAPGKSHYRENLLEHLFIAEVLQECALARDQYVEVLRAEVDESGYDVLFEMDRIVRHVQLKSRFIGWTSRNRNPLQLNPKLQGHLGGCVILMDWRVGEDDRIKVTYRWWGEAPGQVTRPVPERMTLGQMDIIKTTAGLAERLFG